MYSGVGNLSIQVWIFFKCIVCFEVGNGSRMLFWHDKWCGEVGTTLKFQFPNLFKMACLRDATAQEVLSRNESQHY